MQVNRNKFLNLNFRKCDHIVTIKNLILMRNAIGLIHSPNSLKSTCACIYARGHVHYFSVDFNASFMHILHVVT